MRKIRRNRSTGILVMLSALAAIGVLLGRFVKLDIGVFMRFSLETMTIVFSGIVFGPILGATVGIVQDLIGCVVNGYSVILIITLGCASIGAISGIMFRLLKKLPYTVKIALSTVSGHLVGSVIIKTIGLATRYGLNFGVTLAWRSLNYVIIGAAETVLLCFLLKNKQLLTQINRITTFSTKVRFKSSDEATAYAKNVSGVFSKPGLERVTALLNAVGSPEKNIKAVHVTGTNGKGSTSAMLTSILKASGLKVGSFNSPYLVKMRESIRINGRHISKGELVHLLDRLSKVADAMEDKPTEFELLTAAAYLKFAEEKVDIAVIECGMGAIRDATNVITAPLCSVITGIALDHTAFLGASLIDIAREKAGVIKYGAPLVLGEAEGEALDYLTAEAERFCAPIFTPDIFKVKRMTLDGTIGDCGSYTNVRISLLGVHQTKNAAVAIKTAEILSRYFPEITEAAIKRGLSDTVWRGRFEIIDRNPVFIFDGAHNLDGVKSAVKSIKTYFNGKVICLSGVLRDKDFDAMAKEIATVCDTVVTVTPDSKRALAAEDYARALSSHVKNTYPARSIADGVKMARQLAKEQSLPIICLGSLYLYKDIVKEI